MEIRLTRLPDINTDRQLDATPYWAYGRFALLLDGSFWFGDLHSSHPSVTKVGWYWALDRNANLHISPRGAAIDGDLLFNGRRELLAWLIEELVRRRVIRKPTSITVVV